MKKNKRDENKIVNELYVEPAKKKNYITAENDIKQRREDLKTELAKHLEAVRDIRKQLWLIEEIQ